jgi:hypothetical protein
MTNNGQRNIAQELKIELREPHHDELVCSWRVMNYISDICLVTRVEQSISHYKERISKKKKKKKKKNQTIFRHYIKDGLLLSPWL